MRTKARTIFSRPISRNRKAISAVSQEIARFKDLCQLHAATKATGANAPELEQLRRGLAHHRLLLKRLAIQAEEYEGSYQTVVEAFRTIALAEVE